ncbi:MAG: membrane protein insertase YidC [Deltaproteobacteria bacterium]|nr:MAG: membrane protein insertase YidC [Deltaproteobacteria bacterium]
MEQGRLFLAIALCILVFLIWNFFFMPEPPEQKPVKEGQATQETAAQKEPYIQKEDTAAVEKVPLVKQPQEQPDRIVRTITVDTPLYAVNISTKGAVFKSFILKNYREKVEADSPNKEMVSTDASNGTIQLGFDNKQLPDLTEAIFSINPSNDHIILSDKPADIRLSWISDQGIVVEKKYIFSPETYLIGLHVTVQNGSSALFSDRLALTLTKTFFEKGSVYGFQGPSALINNNLEQIKLKKIKDKNLYSGNLGWIAVQDRYFMSAIIPQNPIEASMRLFFKDNNFLEAQYLQPETVVNPGTQHKYEYQLYIGPKSTKILSRYDNNLDQSIDFGMFDILAKPCLWLMNFLYDHFIPNYGVAIIILTLLTKILLWPLGSKSYKSMSEMKKIQPLIKQLREKHKNDRKKMNEETMALYRTYKINPLGGCLPMVVQIPVFFALYRMLYEAIELRHAPFFLWINDLSAPDRLFRFDFSIPFMQPPYGIPVLTLIMGASMLLQQRMSPPMGDPTQAKMMMLMPVVFTFIFINFSSGLVLYWLVNNLVSILQQYYITKKLA